MLFPSEIFLFVFLPLVTILYYGIFVRWRTAKNIFLFFASLLFYAYGERIYIFLMLAVILIHYVLGILVDLFRESRIKSRFVLFLMVAVDVGILGYFKYSGFLIENINNLLGTDIPDVKAALPIGISFFTFQAISYVADVYRERGEVQKNFLNVGLYITLFPQLIAGPIVRYETVAKQIRNRKETWKGFSEGVTRFIIGLGKKVLLANQFAIVADAAFAENGTGNSVAFLWLGAFSYTLQIFFDFAGYSDMAIGLGKMFGFEFEENFKYPYISSSISEFWRRWHISLQTWFRDYIYIPLGGSRVESRGRLVFNLFVVWLLTGIWHGANWTFLVWGLMYFILLTLEKLTGIHKKMGGLGHLYTLFFVVIGWVIFRSDSMRGAITYIKAMFGVGNNGLWDAGTVQYIKQYGIYYIAGIIGCFPVIKNLNRHFDRTVIWGSLYTVSAVGIFLLSILFIFSNAYNPFIYFNF